MLLVHVVAAVAVGWVRDWCALSPGVGVEGRVERASKLVDHGPRVDVVGGGVARASPGR